MQEWSKLFTGKTLLEAEERRVGVTALYGMIQENMPEKVFVNPSGTRQSVCAESLRGKLGSRAKGREIQFVRLYLCSSCESIW